MKCNYKSQYIKLGLLSIVLALFGQLFLVQVKAAVDTIISMLREALSVVP